MLNTVNSFKMMNLVKLYTHWYTKKRGQGKVGATQVEGQEHLEHSPRKGASPEDSLFSLNISRIGTYSVGNINAEVSGDKEIICFTM